MLVNQPADECFPDKACLTGSFSFRKSWIHLAVVFTVVLIAYFWSAPATVVLEDDGYFILAAWFNGIAHPPGYPLYTLMAHIATWFPLGSVALRVHTLSMFFSAFTCLLLWWITYLFFREKPIAYLVALGFGFSSVFWSQSIIAEVYSLQVLLFTLLVLVSINLLHAGNSGSKLFYLKVLFFLTGLGLSNHWPLLLLSLPCLAALLWPQREVVFDNIHRAFPFILFGLLPYVWMVYRSQTNPEISFFGTIDNLSDFWFYISRGAYAGVDASLSAGLYDKLQFVGYFLGETAAQFSIIGGIFVIAGFLYQWRVLPRHISVALLLGFIFPSLGLICLLDFDYDFLHRAIFRVYPLVAYWVAAVWMGAGVMAVARILVYSAPKRLNMNIPVTGFAILLVTATFLHSAVANFRANDSWAENYATVILKTLPENAVLFVSGDTTVGPVGYLHHVRNYRRDIEIYSLAGTLFKNRLYEPFKVDDVEISRRVNDFIHSVSRPVFYNDYLQHNYGWEFYGLYYRFLTDRKQGEHRFVARPEILDYVARIQENGIPADYWEQIHYRTLLGKGCSLVFMISYNAEQPGNNNKLDRLKNKLCSNLLGQYIQLDFLLGKDNPDRQRVEDILHEAPEYMEQAVTREQASRLDYFRGVYSMLEGQFDQAGEYFHICIDKWPHPGNPAYRKLAELNNISQN
ncbi:MAG TPA: DUF2723 domain-containing protein [Gammaproteobacteria bacterium]|nr:DUF2723 domain-containing protein [Gammaproteobacteria bacterium]